MKFPTPLWPLVTTDVLVETFEVRIAGSGSGGSGDKALRRTCQGGVFLRRSDERQKDAFLLFA